MSIESSLRGNTGAYTESPAVDVAVATGVPAQQTTPATSPLSPRAVVHLDPPLPVQPAKIDSTTPKPLQAASTLSDQLKENEANTPKSPVLSRMKSQAGSPVMVRKRASVTLSGSSFFTKTTSSSSSPSGTSSEVTAKRESPRPLPSARVIITHEQLVIPDDASDLLGKWYADEGWKEALKPDEKADPAVVAAQQKERNQNLSTLKGVRIDANGNCVPSDVQIKACHIRFRDEFEGSWAVMKEKCTDKGLMQVINDTRASELKLCLVGISKDFDILNCGSTKLTSDCDFALMSRDQNQAEEAKGVARFNAIFQQRWGRSSASTFDSNAYTMQYSIKCSDFNNEAIRGAQQLKFSRVMANKQSDPESVKKRNEAVLNAVEPAKKQLVAQSLESAAKKAEWAELKVKQGMIEQVVQGAELEDHTLLASKEGTLRAVKGFTYFAASDADKEKIRTTYKNVVEEAFKENPTQLENLRVKVENDIHLALKGGERIRDLQSAMLEGQKTIDALRNAQTGGEFVAIHNDGLRKIIEYCGETLGKTEDPEEIQVLQAQIEGLKLKQLAPEQGDKALQAFKEYDSAANARALSLDLLNALKPKYARLAALDAVTTQDVRTKNEIEKLRAAICKLLNIQNIDIGIVLFECQRKIENIEKNRAKLNEAVETVEDRHCHILVKANAILDAKDQMVIRYQNAQLEGMLFAQEAHVGEGAFDYTVRDLQKGDHENRTLSQMVQHFNEVSAFFKAHQEHVREGAGPEARLVEASKYGLRLVSNIQTTTTRAESFGVTLPNIDGAQLQRFAQLMHALAAVRGTGKTEDEVYQATKSAVGAYRGENPVLVQSRQIAETLTEVNGFVDALSATMDAWAEGSTVAALRDRYV